MATRRGTARGGGPRRRGGQAGPEVAEVEKILTLLRRHQDELESAMDAEQSATLEAERSTLEAQVRSPRPNRRVLRASLVGLRWVADAIGNGTVGGAIALALERPSRDVGDDGEAVHEPPAE